MRETLQRVECVFRTLITMGGDTSDFLRKHFPTLCVLCLSPLYLLPLAFFFLHPLLLCKPLNVCDPFGCLIVIEKSKADKRLSREQSSLYLAPFQPPSYRTPNAKSPSCQRKELQEENVCKELEKLFLLSKEGVSR